MDLGLQHKVAIVTGGSKGIGRGIAEALAAEGANLAICARTAGPLREARQSLQRHGGEVFAVPCDVGDPEALREFLETSRQRFGGVDILVNNVSALHASDDELTAWEASIRLDLLASVRATRQVAPWIAERGGGSILFISSISGLEAGSPPAYAGIKAALISYSKTLAMSLAAQKIRVNTIAPGSIEFEDGNWAWARVENPERYNRTLAKIPWGRLGTPEEVGAVAAFLVSKPASWITGVCLAVDGGQHKGNL